MADFHLICHFEYCDYTLSFQLATVCVRIKDTHHSASPLYFQLLHDWHFPWIVNMICYHHFVLNFALRLSNTDALSVDKEHSAWPVEYLYHTSASWRHRQLKWREAHIFIMQLAHLESTKSTLAEYKQLFVLSELMWGDASVSQQMSAYPACNSSLAPYCHPRVIISNLTQ